MPSGDAGNIILPTTGVTVATIILPLRGREWFEWIFSGIKDKINDY